MNAIGKNFSLIFFSIFKNKDYISKEESLPKDNLNWNSILKLGFDVKNSWIPKNNNFSKYSGLEEEIAFLSTEFYSNLRGNLFYY